MWFQKYRKGVTMQESQRNSETAITEDRKAIQSIRGRANHKTNNKSKKVWKQ